MALIRRNRDRRPGDAGFINVPEGETMMTLEGHTKAVMCLVQLNDGRVVSGSDDKTLKIWDTITGNCLMTLQGHTSCVLCLAQLNDGRLVSGGDDHTLRIFGTLFDDSGGT